MGWSDNLISGQLSSRPVGELEDSSHADFIAVDVETATARRHSICQIGMVAFAGGREVYARETLIDPGCAFEPFNVGIHGISARHVRGSPRFADFHPQLARMVSQRVVVSHSAFDKQAIGQACRTHSLPPVDCRWLDSVRVARDVWPDLPNHRLSTLADLFGLRFRHHDALEDARTAGHIILRAMSETGFGLDRWIPGAGPAAAANKRTSVRGAGDGEGPLTGQVVAMTGTFSMPKADVADLIHSAGGVTGSGVTRQTTILLLGAQDPSALAGKSKSAKHMKAEELIAQGRAIEVWGEDQLHAAVKG